MLARTAAAPYPLSLCLAVAASARQEREKETDAHKLSQRQKQIDFGKNTLGYQNYVKVWPRCVCAFVTPAGASERARQGCTG